MLSQSHRIVIHRQISNYSVNTAAKAIIVCCLLLCGWTTQSTFSQTKYENRGEYYEGLKPVGPSRNDIELLSVLAFGDGRQTEPYLPGQLWIKFYVPQGTSAPHLTIRRLNREVERGQEYWLDRVRLRSTWTPGFQTFSWPTAVLQEIGITNKSELGVILLSDTDAPERLILPATLYSWFPPNEITSYQFAFRTYEATELHFGILEDKRSGKELRRPESNTFRFTWNSIGAPDGWYTLVVTGRTRKGYVRYAAKFYHKQRFEDDAPTDQKSDEINRLDREVKKSIQDVVEELKAQEESLTPIKSDAGSNYYASADVVDQINRGRTKLVNKLQLEGLAGLRAYIKDSYPVLPVRGWPTPNGGLVPEQTKRQAFDKVTEFLSTLWNKLFSEEGSSTVDIDVSSDPIRAEIQITADGGDMKRTFTNSALTNVYRGKWRYTISKDGYLPDSGPLDLIDEKGTTLKCELFRPSDNKKSLCKRN